MRSLDLIRIGALLIAGSGLLGYDRAALAADPASKLQELQHVQERIRQLQSIQTNTKRDLAQQQRELARLDQAIGEAAKQVRHTEQALHEQQQLHQRTLAEHDQLQLSLAQQRQALGAQIKAAYLFGRQQTLQLILSQQTPDTLGRTLAYYDYFHKARVNQITQFNDQLQKLQRLTTSIEEQTEDLRALQRQTNQKKQGLERAKAQRAPLLVALRKELVDQDRRLQHLQTSERDLTNLIEKLRKALADLPAEMQDSKPFSKLKGQLYWPLQGRLLARYGDSRNTSELAWNGVLIGAKVGSEVAAVSHGRVAFADWLNGFGLLLIIDHGGGYMTLYGYNQSLFKEVGDWVSKGEVIASVGNSGGHTEQALYFEIRSNGKPVDPNIWCKSR